MTAAPPDAPQTASAPRIRVHVNGQPCELADGATVSALLAQLGYTTGAVAVERNREVVPRASHATTELKTGDEVEVVTFVGGG